MGIRSGILLATLVAGVAVGAAAQAVKERSPATESLFLAIRTNDIGAVKRSLLAGADVEAENDEGRTSIDVAIDRGHFAIAHYLLAWRKQLMTAKAKAKAAPPPVVAESPPEPQPRIMPPAREPPSVLSPTPAAPVTAQPLAPAPVPVETPPPEVAATPPVAETPAATPEKPTETAAVPTPAATMPVAPLPATGKITPPGDAAPRQGGFFESLANFFSGAASSDTPPDDASPPPSSPPKPAASPAAAPAAAPSVATATPTTTSKPATDKPAPAGEPPVRDSVLDYIAGVLAEAQRANTPAPAPAKREAMPAPAPAPAPTPGPVPVRAPAAATIPEKPAGDADSGELLGRITEFFTVTPKRPPPQPASASRATAPQPAEAPPVRRATVEPWLGDNQRLGKPRPADGSGACVDKSALPATFCIETVRWPAKIADAFDVQTQLTRGGQVIVRYDDDVATQFHVVFPTANYRAIVDYFSIVLGPPGDTPERSAAEIGKPSHKNHTARWLGPKDAAGGDDVLLEVREIDDLRWSSPPDPAHGVVRLLRVGADMMFKHVSWSDFLLVKIHQTR